MMRQLKVKKLGVILKPTALDFEKTAVLNPGVQQEGDTVHLFYRAVDKNLKSSIGYARLKGPTKVVERIKKPVIGRTFAYESKGVEDPRIVKINGTHYMTYTAHDGKNAIVCYATSRDLKTFKKEGVISPRLTYDEAAKLFSRARLKDRYFMFEAYYEEYAGKRVLLWEKDMFLFPRKIRGKFAMLHRILPDIQVVYFRNFNELKQKNFWKNYLKNLSKYVVLENKFWFESRNIGGGAPPIETKDGWLIVFHTVEELNLTKVYHASAALLDIHDPTKVIGRLEEPLFSPDQPWEKFGLASNVVFPTDTAVFGDDLYIYYGAADQNIAVAKVSLSQLIKTLKNHAKNNKAKSGKK